MRYLGQIIGLMSPAPSAPPTGRPLPFAVTLCMTELLARAAKQLLRQQLQLADAAQLAATVAHFLNCLLEAPQPASSGGGGGGNGHSAGNKNQSLKSQRSAKRKGNAGKSSAKGGVNSGGDARRGGGASKFTSTLTHALLWEQIAEVARIHFCASISATVVHDYNISKLALLRSVCQKNGVQLLAKDYVFDPTAPKAGAAVFAAADVVCIHPTVKNTPPTFVEGHALECAATAQFQAGYRQHFPFPQHTFHSHNTLSLAWPLLRMAFIRLSSSTDSPLGAFGVLLLFPIFCFVRIANSVRLFESCATWSSRHMPLSIFGDNVPAHPNQTQPSPRQKLWLTAAIHVGALPSGREPAAVARAGGPSN
jgi:hypothetical protein